MCINWKKKVKKTHCIWGKGQTMSYFNCILNQLLCVFRKKNQVLSLEETKYLIWKQYISFFYYLFCNIRKPFELRHTVHCTSDRKFYKTQGMSSLALLLSFRPCVEVCACNSTPHMLKPTTLLFWFFRLSECKLWLWKLVIQSPLESQELGMVILSSSSKIFF